MLAIKGIENVEKSKGPLNVGDVFTNTIFRNIVLSLLATLGLYLLASLIFVSLLSLSLSISLLLIFSEISFFVSLNHGI